MASLPTACNHSHYRGGCLGWLGDPIAPIYIIGHIYGFSTGDVEREAANFDAGMVKCWSFIDANGFEQVHLLHSSESWLWRSCVW